MGKRLKRIMNFEIVANLKELQNKEVDLVLANNKTLHGYIKQIDSQMAVLEDKRFERHQLKLDDIVEIVFDFEAPN
jgi:small nuclear ribonucleoprotein (snRNP)-like protein